MSIPLHVMLAWGGWFILVLVLEAWLIRKAYPSAAGQPAFHLDHVVMKMSSGRWLCTMGAVVAFLWMIVHNMITQDQALMVVNNVFLFYFLRDPEKKEQP